MMYIDWLIGCYISGNEVVLQYMLTDAKLTEQMDPFWESVTDKYVELYG